MAFGLPFLLALEATTRLDQWWSQGAPLLGEFTYESALQERDEAGVRGRPHGRYEKWKLNAHGLRGPDLATPKPPGVVRIASIGASETFGLYETPGREWPRQLEAELRASGLEAEVLNASIAGMGLRTRIAFFRDRVLDLDPDIALLMLEYSSYPGVVARGGRPLEFQAADSGVSFAPRVLRKTKEAVLPRLPERLRHVLQTGLIRYRVSRLRARLGDEFGRYRAVSADELSEFEADLDDFLRLAKVRDIAVVVLVPALRLDDETLADYSANFPYIARSWIEDAAAVFPEAVRRIAGPPRRGCAGRRGLARRPRARADARHLPLR